MVTSLNTRNEFTYIWKIKNLGYCTLQTGESIVSPMFIVPQFQNTKWYLQMSPKEQTEETYMDVYGLCYLFRGDDSGPETIEIKFDISCNFKKNSFSIFHSFFKNSGYGYTNLHLGREDHFQDCFSIILEMKSLEMHTNATKCIDNFLPSTSITNLHLSYEKALEIPIRCLAETRVIYDKKTTQWPINCLMDSPKSVEIIPFGIAKKYPIVIVDLNTDPECEKYKVIDVRLLNGKVKKPLFVTCEINVCCKQKDIYFLRDEHTFTAENAASVWDLDIFLEMEDFKKIATANNALYKELYLKLDFTFSYGKMSSVIVSVEHVPSNLIFSNDSGVSNNILSLCKGKKLYDVELKVNRSSFYVHKAVLSASSPVFAAMFMSKMSEAASNVVNIVDLDKDTVAQMVEFLYTGSLKELDFEKAQNLFIAADKYQISCLLNLSRNFIIDHINMENICLILYLSDTYSDSKLEKEAVNFIKLNKNRILTSTEWEKLEKDNVSLALKTFKKVCLLSKRAIM